jgi:hypothetical protein
VSQTSNWICPRFCAFVSMACCAFESIDKRTVVKPRGWTSTPRVAMYFFSNSPVKWRLTKVVCRVRCQLWFSYCLVVCHALRRLWPPRTFLIEYGRPQRTFPVPPSPTRTSLKVGTLPLASAMIAVCCGGVCGVNCANLVKAKCQRRSVKAAPELAGEQADVPL